MTLSAQERKALMFIQGHLEQHGYPPSIREVGMALGYRAERSGPRHLLQGLAAKGYVMMDADKSRTTAGNRSFS